MTMICLRAGTERGYTIVNIYINKYKWILNSSNSVIMLRFFVAKYPIYIYYNNIIK